MFPALKIGTVIHRIDRPVVFGAAQHKGMRDQESAVLEIQTKAHFQEFCANLRFFPECQFFGSKYEKNDDSPSGAFSQITYFHKFLQFSPEQRK